MHRFFLVPFCLPFFSLAEQVFFILDWGGEDCSLEDSGFVAYQGRLSAKGPFLILSLSSSSRLKLVLHKMVFPPRKEVFFFLQCSNALYDGTFPSKSQLSGLWGVIRLFLLTSEPPFPLRIAFLFGFYGMPIRGPLSFLLQFPLPFRLLKVREIVAGLSALSPESLFVASFDFRKSGSFLFQLNNRHGFS